MLINFSWINVDPKENTWKRFSFTSQILNKASVIRTFFKDILKKT